MLYLKPFTTVTVPPNVVTTTSTGTGGVFFASLGGEIAVIKVESTSVTVSDFVGPNETAAGG